MFNLPGPLGTVVDLMIVIVGFGLIIFVHELGHFIAARWAGIRVLAFAIGFGPPLFTYRKGLGIRRRSSEQEYLERAAAAGAPDAPPDATPISPTEYRVNVLPLGGYVKMLGQDDLDPGAVSASRDSYQRCPPWKRMVVISAGVVMNMISAAALFIIVFMIGLQTEPAKVGSVTPGGAASLAVPVGDRTDAVGLRPGDEIIEIAGRRPNSFNDVSLAAATAARGQTIDVVVRRPGLEDPLRFSIEPRPSPLTNLLDLGIMPARLPVLAEAPERGAGRESWDRLMERRGLPGLPPGARLVRINDNASVDNPVDLSIAVDRSGGRPIELEFLDETTGESLTYTVRPTPSLQQGLVRGPGGEEFVHTHLLGLSPVMIVHPENDGRRGRSGLGRVFSRPAASQDLEDLSQGLRSNDVFARLGSVEYPALPDGITEIRAHRGRKIDITVLRRSEPGAEPDRVALRPDVNRQGQIGFIPSDIAETDTIVGTTPRLIRAMREGSEPAPPPAAGLIRRPGSRVLAVDGTEVGSFLDLRTALVDATRDALERGEADTTVTLDLELPLPAQPGGVRPRTSLEWTLDRDALEQLHALGWEVPFGAELFQMEQTLLRASGPLDAIGLGLSETRRVMVVTYITFARLFQGTVRVEHLKGPVGIAHIGTLLADRGFVWLMFFMALISVNLAVINFLPLPIVDGGQFLMLVYEQLRGRPVPIPVQNAVTMAGLLLIGSVFLIVTFNDVRSLLGL